MRRMQNWPKCNFGKIHKNRTIPKTNQDHILSGKNANSSNMIYSSFRSKIYTYISSKAILDKMAEKNSEIKPFQFKIYIELLCVCVLNTDLVSDKSYSTAANYCALACGAAGVLSRAT